MKSLVPTSHCLLLSPGCVQAGAGQLLSVPNSALYSGVGSSPFSASKPPTIVCRARNEPTQRSIKPGSSQPTVSLTPNCPLSLVCVCVCVWAYVSVRTSHHHRPHCCQFWACLLHVTSWVPARLFNLKVNVCVRAACQHLMLLKTHRLFSGGLARDAVEVTGRNTHYSFKWQNRHL